MKVSGYVSDKLIVQGTIENPNPLRGYLFDTIKFDEPILLKNTKDIDDLLVFLNTIRPAFSVGGKDNYLIETRDIISKSKLNHGQSKNNRV